MHDNKGEGAVMRPLLSIVAICSLEDKEEKLKQWFVHLPKHPGVEVIVCFTVPRQGEAPTGIRHLRSHNRVRLFSYAYDNFSFSEARNAAIRQARAEWILSLDVDEVVPQHQHASLIDMAANVGDDYDCFFCHVASVINTPMLERYTSQIARVPRLFRNRTDIQFKGHCHEFVTWVIPQERHGECSLMICHTGYMADTDTLLAKHDRNARLLARDLYEAKPGDVRTPFIKSYLRATLNQEHELLEYQSKHDNATN